MASRWKAGMMGLTALMGLALQACIVVPARSHRGYGGSGYASEVNPDEARDRCFHAARDYRGYRWVRPGAVAITGPETARVDLQVGRGSYRRYVIECQYNARTGAAYVP